MIDSYPLKTLNDKLQNKLSLKNVNVHSILILILS
jgi:hypothetical protein